MFEIRISGGVGNQLFQYAQGYSLSRKYGQKVILDTSYFDYDDFRVYELDKFNLQIDQKISYMDNINTQGFVRYLQIIVGILKKRKRLKDFEIIEEGDECAVKDLSKGDYYFRGFWQNERYFKEYRKDLMQQIVLKEISREYREYLEKIKGGAECISTYQED